MTTVPIMSRSKPSIAPASLLESENADLLTLNVREFGPIAKATINIRPLTIFVGRSNTGKTYLSKLIYAIHKTFSGFPQIPLVGMHHIPYGFDESINSQLTAFRDHPESEYGQQEIRSLISQSYELHRRIENGKILEEIGRCFGTTNLSTTRRAHSKKRNFKIEVLCSSGSRSIWNVSIGYKKTNISADTKFDSNAIEFAESMCENFISEMRSHPYFASPKNNEEFLSWISFAIGNFILKTAYPDSGDYQDSYFLPANRGGILESHKFVADVWLSQIPNLGLRHLPALQPLPKVSVDFIRTMLMNEDSSRAFGRRQTPSGARPLESVAKFIEDELIGGKLQANTSTEAAYPVFEYLPSHAKRALKLDAASSMVSELAPIIAIARSHLDPFDLLIIEEPEAHLHPGALPLIARCLARLVRNNVRVLISTHSDWLLKSLRNLILEGDLIELGFSGKSVSEDSYLLRSEVGAWEFSTSDEFNGTTVSEIEFDEFDGIEPSEIERISDSLYNESVAKRNRKARLAQ